jgi:hypothetical protein
MSGKDETNDRDGMRQFLLELVHDNPIDSVIAKDVGRFTTNKASGAWIARQEAAGKLKCVGTTTNRLGRKVNRVFCNGWIPKDDNLRHELIGTRLRLLYDEYEFDRGHRVGNCFADLVMRNGGRRFEMEVDCNSTKSRIKICGRVEKHNDCDCDILFVVSDPRGNCERRLRQLMDWLRDARENVFFTTLSRLQEHGAYARVWDYIGRQGELKRVPLPVGPMCPGNSDDTP